LLQAQPEAEIKTPENFVRSGFLGDNGQQAATQLGLLGLGFAPGAGFSDYAGTFPSAQGGVEPSFQQNVQQGNYLTAGLQGLGALGDAATLSAAALGPFAPLAAGVGMTAKVPRAVQKGVQGLIDVVTPAPASVMPKVDELGFYSAIEKALLDNPQQKGTGQQFLAQLQKTPGVKPEEIQYTGLDQFLANKPNVTKPEIQDFLDTNRVQLQEVRLENANPYPYKTVDEFMSAISQQERAGNWQEVDRLTQAMEAQEGVGAGNASRFHLGAIRDIQTEIPGGTNYREVLLTLPAKQRPNNFTLRNNESGGTVGAFDTMEEAQEFLQTTPREDIRSGNWSVQEKSGGSENVYRSSHFNQSNILAHMRVNDRTVDGKPTLFVEEIQSDWHQAGRKKGYQGQKFDPISDADYQRGLSLQQRQVRGERLTLDESAELQDILNRHTATIEAIKVPDAPFKTSWHELTLKKAINEAATKGYDQIAFTTGATQAERYDLSKQVDSIDYRVFGYGDDAKYELGVVDKNGQDIPIPEQFYSAKELENVVGKEMANKIISGEGQSGGGRMTLRGVDLKVGGEGMKGFYDKILPKSLEKLGKKYGVKPVLTEMDTPDGKVQVWKFPVPKEMAETVKSQGQPLFQIGAGAAGLGTAGLLATEEEQF
jgi:hypothetical protein